MKIWGTGRKGSENVLVHARRKSKFPEGQLEQRVDRIPKSPIFFSAVLSFLILTILKGTSNIEGTRPLRKIQLVSSSESEFPSLLITQNENPNESNSVSEDSQAVVDEGLDQKENTKTEESKQ